MAVQIPMVMGMGWIEVVCGSMFSGKTEELIRRLNRACIAKQRVQIFKPTIDDRFSEKHVTSHSELKMEAQNIKNPEEILSLLHDDTRVVGIDEAQFFPTSILDITDRLARRGMRVIVAGLDLDYRGVPFGPIPALMAVAESVTKMSAVCMVCGGAACRTQRMVSKDGEMNKDQVAVGAGELYEARCRRCYEAP